jgi:RNA polymerase sigma-70 factor (ECF subfamily)
MKKEDNLISLISSGDEGAFSAFVKEKARYFYYVAYRIVFSRDVAEDIVQSAFAKLWEKRNKLDVENGNLSAWVYRVVVNLAIDDKRRLKTVEIKEDVDSGEDISQDIIKLEKNRKLESELQKLTPRHRAAIMMVYYDEIPQKEAAENMGISLKALESILSRAKLILRERMDERVQKIV